MNKEQLRNQAKLLSELCDIYGDGIARVRLNVLVKHPEFQESLKRLDEMEVRDPVQE